MDAESKKSATNTPDLSDFFKAAGGLLGGLGALGNMFGGQQKRGGGQTPGGNGAENGAVPKGQGIPPGHAAPKGQEGASEKTRDGSAFSLKNFKFLSNYGIDLNKKAREGKIDNIVGRQRETDRVIQILNRRTKNNPALVGEPGVGKTAIAEGLALRIVRKEVPYKLLDKVVVMLDLTAIVAGTQFRGQFESRMKGTIDEVKKAGNIILVIDEVHNIIGAGEAEGSLNAANILKPALSRGEIQVIGTTTLKEYRKYIEKDGALERRFQPVMVEEPSVEETVEILKGIRDTYAEYHYVRISDELLEDCAKLAERYISDRFLPDKAIDVFDEACSRANLRNKVPELIAELERKKRALKAEINVLDMEIDKAQSKPAVIKQSDDTEATVVEDREMELFKKRADLFSESARIDEQISDLDEQKYVDVTYDDVAKVIETWTGIPVKMISAEEAEKLLNLEDALKQHIIGQDKAVSSVSRAIRRNRSGFRKRFKPSSFIFAGPTGVGKTELVKQLTLEMFGTIDALIRLDMSEYMEKHTVSKLIGSPPGYVGYDEAGQLTEKVRRHPYSVILFDEIEKAHPDVFNMLLQILDDGRLTDSQGRVVHFENTVIILTTNAYGKQNGISLGFGTSDPSGDAQKAAETALKKVFRPEFLNRIDEIVLFDPLSEGSLKKIVKLMLKEVEAQCGDLGITFEITDAAVAAVVKNGYEEEYGARPLRRYIQKNIEDELAEMALKGQLQGIKGIKVDAADDVVSILRL
ncbi:MAG: ATP-dependent Clp protease ATP-binding subunit [Clostridia bacterium]|nr:ATP-dependent Clp protease ATP-binding subunit [Clostridia bacterium]